NTTQTGSGRYRTPCGKPAAYTAEKHRSQSGRQLAKTQRSLSRPGNPYDNAVVESTNRLVRKELIHRNVYTNVEQPRSDVNRYVWWYNHQRLHSTLGYLSPVEFTQQGKTL
ncbi:integrase core domain-containing protein, partial [Bifidobacterium longum]|uniref:integrase core domain-containing protein n=1 Tax=Bifidobacterium longum TaxID=216816 RepID=UPI001106D249